MPGKNLLQIPPPFSRERRYRRFKLAYPVHALVRSNGLTSEVEAVSVNVCTGGLLMESPAPIPQHSSVCFILRLRGRTHRLIELLGEGKVVRVEHRGPSAEFAIALECKNPISQIEAIGTASV
ncbi:MAG TPA: hypothetical protein VEN79_11645 [Terriglobia bacterium]|nr:hypothetical protein [Terriglobia bacterium]